MQPPTLEDLEDEPGVEGPPQPHWCDCGAPGLLCFDPFAQDVWNKEVEVVLCGECYSASCNEI